MASFIVGYVIKLEGKIKLKRNIRLNLAMTNFLATSLKKKPSLFIYYIQIITLKYNYQS